MRQKRNMEMYESINNIEHFGDGRDWFFEKRFGMMVCWGIYAGKTIGEQGAWRQGMLDYEKLADEFNPVEFDPEKWIDAAEDAGMEYLVFIAKHHDGFCLWDTAETDFNIMNTPYGKDALATLSDVCHKRDFPLVIYYSCVDWHHPEYPNIGRTHELFQSMTPGAYNYEKYIEYLKRQVIELCSNYGEIHGFWWDINQVLHHDPSINDMIRELQPQAVINNRGYDVGDFNTPERFNPGVPAFSLPTEVCQSVGQKAWGYSENEDYFSDKHLMFSIDYNLSKGGNFVLNVAPNELGEIPETQHDILRNIGKWFKKISDSQYGARPVLNLVEDENIAVTAKGNSLYIHCHNLTCTAVDLRQLAALPLKAILLNTGEKLDFDLARMGNFWYKPEFLRIRHIPVNKLEGEIPVIRLDYPTLNGIHCTFPSERKVNKETLSWHGALDMQARLLDKE